ncbi:MarR family transcriptional regulator [Planosporangium thailandense]|uniref:MarR family transcriptional regulator n=1 Tax=Planosporangium thailandense TaxID=765197 RepID=A0ABX0XV36_9ACTN|nr:MarR family transcriptional regulator [Planosporangium thailandense]NJC69250.1 MarR family transcriptional regulator [Planosporangium thailandense]
MAHADLLAQLEVESRRYLAAYVLFNQAVADKLGLHPTDLQCLNLLTIESGPVTTSQIAELTGLTSGSASRLVERLVKAGYVTRQQDGRDRRRVLVQPVPEAVRRIGAVWDDLGKDWEGIFADYTEAELAVLVRHMRRTTELSRAQVRRLRG